MGVVNWSNVTDFAGVPAAANVGGDGFFWSGMLYMIWVVALLITFAWGIEISLLVSSFLGLILSLLLVYSDLIPIGHVWFFTAVIIMVAIYSYWSGRKINQT